MDDFIFFIPLFIGLPIRGILFRNSLVLLKDGQAVFTNLEKTILYRNAIIRAKTVDKKEQIDLILALFSDWKQDSNSCSFSGTLYIIVIVYY